MERIKRFLVHRFTVMVVRIMATLVLMAHAIRIGDLLTGVLAVYFFASNMVIESLSDRCEARRLRILDLHDEKRRIEDYNLSLLGQLTREGKKQR